MCSAARFVDEAFPHQYAELDVSERSIPVSRNCRCVVLIVAVVGTQVIRGVTEDGCHG